MFRNIVDDFRRVCGVAARRAVIVNFAAFLRRAVFVDHHKVSEVTGHPQTGQIGQMADLVIAQAGEFVWQHARAAADALVLTQRIAGIERAAAAHGIAQAIGERADTGTFQVDLRGDFKTIALVRVPAFAEEVDIRVQGLNALPRRQNLRFRVIAHQVEAETIDFIIGGPYRQRVGDQLGEHPMLRRGVGTAGGGFDAAGGFIQTLIVPGYDLIQYRRAIGRTRGVGVVVDHVHNDVHPQILLDRLNHGAELFDARRAFRIGRVGSFRNRVVERIVAPVVGVGLRHQRIQRLHLRIILAIALLKLIQYLFHRGAAVAVSGELAAFHRAVHFTQATERLLNIGDLVAELVHRRQIEDRQQLNVRHT